jgi:hypothetical protein
MYAKSKKERLTLQPINANRVFIVLASKSSIAT